MKKILLLVILLFTLMACEEAEEDKREQLVEDIVIEYASEYIGSDIERYIIDIDKVEYTYHNGERHLIMKDGLYGKYFFIEYYFDVSNQDYVMHLIVKLWYETEAKIDVIKHETVVV